MPGAGEEWRQPGARAHTGSGTKAPPAPSWPQTGLRMLTTPAACRTPAEGGLAPCGCLSLQHPSSGSRAWGWLDQQRGWDEPLTSWAGHLLQPCTAPCIARSHLPGPAEANIWTLQLRLPPAEPRSGSPPRTTDSPRSHPVSANAETILDNEVN